MKGGEYMKIQDTNYTMLFCNIEKKSTAHKVYWTCELQGLKPRYFASFLCGKCQWGLIQARTHEGIFHTL
jgi:hypothetical protein